MFAFAAADIAGGAAIQPAAIELLASGNNLLSE
jgi:hypothetical protein